MGKIYVGKSDNAIDIIDLYKDRGFKIYKVQNNSTLFVDNNCDITSESSFVKTMRFGFWLDNDEFYEDDYDPTPSDHRTGAGC